MNKMMIKEIWAKAEKWTQMQRAINPENPYPHKYQIILHQHRDVQPIIYAKVAQKFFRKNYREALDFGVAVMKFGEKEYGAFNFDIAETKLKEIRKYLTKEGIANPAAIVTMMKNEQN